jgi:thiol-disulfide isomerase/thioredoxin
MWAGIVAVAVAVAVACAVALYRRRVDGRFARSGPASRAAGDSGRPTEGSDRHLSGADLGTPLGADATVVQFSSSLCAPCRTAERVITDAVSGLDGVRYVKVDAEQRLDLVGRFNVLRTPTILITDGAGRVIGRTAGVPTRQSLDAGLPAGARG